MAFDTTQAGNAGDIFISRSGGSYKCVKTGTQGNALWEPINGTTSLSVFAKKEYDGDISNSTIILPTTNGEDKLTSTVKDIISSIVEKTSNMSVDGSTYTGDVTGAIGGVKAQTSPANLTAAPTEADFNNLLTLLKSAGVFK